MGDKKWAFEIPAFFKNKKIKKDQVLIVFLTGVLLLIIAIPTGKKSESTDSEGTAQEVTYDTAGDADTQEYVSYLERHLKEVLTQMEGAGDITVMITLQASAERVVEKDIQSEDETVTESDSQGGSRTTQNNARQESTIYSGDGTSEQEPYISKELSPQIEGVVVLATGGDDPVVIKNITEAVQALFGIDTHKIRIMKKN